MRKIFTAFFVSFFIFSYAQKKDSLIKSIIETQKSFDKIQNERIKEANKRIAIINDIEKILLQKSKNEKIFFANHQTMAAIPFFPLYYFFQKTVTTK